MSKLISELLDLPERVRKGDFVLNLSKGVNEPQKTLERYVVTPQLVECFNDSLNMFKTAVKANNCKAAYLHGSFGSGKSHFMAVLHLILQHNPDVRSVKELLPVCDEHKWIEDKNFLLIPYHMINAKDMETSVDEVKTKIKCNDCSYMGGVAYKEVDPSWHYRVPIFNCVQCQSSRTEIVQGKELKIKTIDVSF